MKISRCENSQISQVIALHKEIFDEDNKTFFENLVSKPYYKTYVATQENIIVAYCIISVIDGQAELINIGTKEDFRKQGVAKQLLTFVLKDAEFEKMFLEVSTNNIAAIRLYNAVGFHEISRRKKYYGDYDAIIMERQKSL